MKRASGEAGGRRGLTLIELLLVMSLMALVLGMGLGMFSALDLRERSIVSEVQNVVRTANNWAQARSARARVRVDAARGALHAEGLEPVGTWHFEALPIQGAFDIGGGDFGAELDPDGFQGHALSFTRQNGAHAELFVADDPAFDLTQGFLVQCALRLDEPRGGRILTYGKRTLYLEVDGEGALEAGFESEREAQAGGVEQSGVARARSAPGALRAGRWTRVELAYDRRELVLSVDGVPVARSPETAAVSSVGGTLVLSDQRRPFAGSLDNLVVAVVARGEEVVLPQGMRFVEGAPAEIAFAAGGGLDRALHPAPLELGIELDDGQRRTLVIGLYGTVR